MDREIVSPAALLDAARRAASLDGDSPSRRPARGSAAPSGARGDAMITNTTLAQLAAAGCPAELVRAYSEAAEAVALAGAGATWRQTLTAARALHAAYWASPGACRETEIGFECPCGHEPEVWDLFAPGGCPSAATAL